MRRLFPNWTYRCASRWLVIGGIVALLGGVAIAATHAKSGPVAGLTTSPSACKPGVNCPPPPPPSFAMALAAPVATPEPANGPSPSAPLPATSTWLAQTALALVFGLQLLKKAAPKLFAGDGLGFIVALVASQLTVFTEALSRGESPSWALAKQAFVLGVLAAGGYSVAWRKGLKPLLQKAVTKVLGLPVPGWLA